MSVRSPCPAGIARPKDSLGNRTTLRPHRAIPASRGASPQGEAVRGRQRPLAARPSPTLSLPRLPLAPPHPLSANPRPRCPTHLIPAPAAAGAPRGGAVSPAPSRTDRAVIGRRWRGPCGRGWGRAGAMAAPGAARPRKVREGRGEQGGLGPPSGPSRQSPAVLGAGEGALGVLSAIRVTTPARGRAFRGRARLAPQPPDWRWSWGAVCGSGPVSARESWAPRAAPAASNEDQCGLEPLGACPLRGKAEGAVRVQPREEMAESAPLCINS